VKAELAKAFDTECDCKTKVCSVKFTSPFRRGDCGESPVSRIFLLTDLQVDNALKLKTPGISPKCQHTGGVSNSTFWVCIQSFVSQKTELCGVC
jgi:hypothetical protein